MINLICDAFIKKHDKILGIDVQTIIVNSSLMISACVLFIIASHMKDIATAIWKKKKLSPKKLKDDVERDQRIYSTLGQMEERFHCDRANIYLLHNGGSFNNGIDMQKMSCVYEICRLGIGPNLHQNQSLLLTGMPDCVAAILEAHHRAFHIKTKDLKNSQWKATLVRHGIEVLVLKALTQGNRIIGFIGIEYCWEYDKDIKSITLNEYAIQCESLLSGNIDCLSCTIKGIRCIFCKIFKS